MTQNPYYPQQQPPPSLPTSKPATLVWAVRGMYAGAALAALGVLSTLLFREQIEDGLEDVIAEARTDGAHIDVDTFVTIGLAIGVGVGLLTVALWIWMAIMNDRGRNWARIMATVFGALTLCGTPVSATQPTVTGLMLVQSLVTVALVIAILVLLWLPSTSAYFKAQSATRR